MRKLIVIPSLLALSIGLVACANKPNTALEQARENVTQLQNSPEALKLAPLETKDAVKMLDKADKAYREGKKEDNVSQLAYLTSQRAELAKQTIALKNGEKELKNKASERAQAILDAREIEIKHLQDKLNAKQTERGSLVTFGDVLFDLDKAELKPAAHNNIRQLAEFLRDNPERKVLIEGFTDSTGSAEYNLQLSERRAEAVKRALVREGVNSNNLNTIGFGKEYPVADNATPASRSMNRRVEVTISHDDKAVAPRR
ncbi:MAG TPA: OmpA family protein [Thiopseudomonas sp.]|nr:OmpA family protein [Thiopseudomonas sp.]